MGTGIAVWYQLKIETRQPVILTGCLVLQMIMQFPIHMTFFMEIIGEHYLHLAFAHFPLARKPVELMVCDSSFVKIRGRGRSIRFRLREMRKNERGAGNAEIINCQPAMGCNRNGQKICGSTAAGFVPTLVSAFH
jgi:hypothetical protein